MYFSKQFRRWFRTSLPEQSIHLREKSIVSPTEKSKMRKHLLVRREGLTLFDEDDVCAGFRDSDTARLNCFEKYIKSAKLPDQVINEKLLFKRLHGRVFRDMYEFKVHELGKIAHHLGSNI